MYFLFKDIKVDSITTLHIDVPPANKVLLRTVKTFDIDGFLVLIETTVNRYYNKIQVYRILLRSNRFQFDLSAF